MKTVIKIFILFALIFGISIYATKKSIDLTFEKAECSYTSLTSPLDYNIQTEEV
jgi:hypothetical protein